MKAHIAVAPTAQAIPNQPSQSDQVPIIGNGGAGVIIALLGVVAGKNIPWGEITKLFAGTTSSKVLMEENRKNQELEGEIDINQGLSNTLSGIAKDTVTTAMSLLEKSVAAAQLYAEASVSTNKATEHLTSATRDLIDAFNALTLAQSREGQETRKVLKEVFEGQELTQENLAAAVTTIGDKIAVIDSKIAIVLQNQEDVKRSNRELEAKLEKAIADLKIELATAIASLG